MTRPWRWLGERLILAVHDEQIAEHGGVSGIRDAGLLQSALARPPNLALYGNPDAFDLAACYAFGIAQNHPFDDGNKRAAFVAAVLVLLDHGWELNADDAACVWQMLRLAGGEVEQKAFGAWLREHSVAFKEPP